MQSFELKMDSRYICILDKMQKRSQNWRMSKTPLKGTYYNKIFPINTEPLSVDTMNQVREFAKKIKDVKQTNMLELVEYCFEQLSESLWRD